MSAKSVPIPRYASFKLAMTFALFLLAAAAWPAGAAKAGILDFDLSSASVALTGEWERYEGVYTDEGIESSGARPRLVEVGSRRGIPPSGRDAGYATYRLRIRLTGVSASSGRLALLMTGASGIDAVLANGSPLYDKAVLGRPPLIMPFEAAGSDASIIIHCGPGGRRLEEASLLPLALVLAGADEVGPSLIGRSVPFAALAAFFAFAAIIVLFLYFFWSKTREFISFSVAMLASGLCLALEGASIFGLAPRLLDGLAIAESAYAAAAMLMLAAFATFFGSALRDRLPRFAPIAASSALGALAALAIILPSRAGLAAMIGAAAAGLSCLGLFAASAVMAARGQARGCLIGGALLALGAGLALSRLLPDSFSSTYLAGPAGLAAFGFAILLLLLKKSGNTLDTVESLTEHIASISKTVKNFIPREFLEHLNKSDVADLRLGDHTRKKMTIFFSDIRAFTELSENLTVEENFAFINSYLSRVVPVIRENGGFVDKYVGDAIMALFGGANGPDLAIKSAIAMNAKMVEYNSHRAKVGYRPISMGVGVHTGDLMLGVVGVSDRMENTVISDAVNLGSRLQAITKAFNVSLAISEQAFKELEDPGIYKYRFIGKVKVRGKAEPVSVFEIFDGIAPELFERKMKANMFFEQGMLSYYQKDFADAMYYFKRSLEIIPEDGASAFYLDNCMAKAVN